MVEVPIYSDDNNPKVCESCHETEEIKLTPCVDTRTNTPINACITCLEKKKYIIPISECMPSGDVVM